MWVFLHDAFFSVVEDRKDKDVFVVRSRLQEDLEKVFVNDITGLTVKNILETENSDYRFRVFLPKSIFKEIMLNEIDDIDYHNFKNEVHDHERKLHYTNVWSEMLDLQEHYYPPENSNNWLAYLQQKYGSTHVLNEK